MGTLSRAPLGHVHPKYRKIVTLLLDYRAAVLLAESKENEERTLGMQRQIDIESAIMSGYTDPRG